MTRLITPSELEHLSEVELRSKLSCVWHNLIRSEQGSMERTLALASLENIERVLCRRLWVGPKP